MAVVIGGVEKRVGLALSGGGFRAAAFHLGVFRKLQALGLLSKVDLLSCVSGGSIAGAFLALNWGKPDTLDRLERYLATRSIAVVSVLGGLLDPTASRVDWLADSYDNDLFEEKTLAALAGGPRVYLNTTNLATGNLFFFVAGGGKPEEMGDYELGVQSASNIRISRAVAASSSFPPVFNPVVLSRKEYKPTGDTEYVTLTDGGVYDNLAVNPLLRVERNAIDIGIISDGGKPFATNDRPTESGLGVLKEMINVLMEQVRGLQFDRLLQRHAAQRGPKPLWFSIDSPVGEANAGDAELASGIGTDLKKLSPAEIALLGRHGGALVEARLKKYAPELLER
jgi:NTE family protein